jgi:uncharacterized RDD family membrane protein YckC
MRHIAGFWGRFFAFAIDAVILATVGSIIAIFFFNALADLGPVGPLMGFFIALVYFAIPESSIGSGQSIGKRLLGLRVVNVEGNLLSIEESLIRYTVFAIPWFLNGLPLPVSRTPWIVTNLLGIAVFGIGGSTLYLLTFNRATRQGLHDLAVRSYVVKAHSRGIVSTLPIWKPHRYVVGALILIFGVVGPVIGSALARKGSFSELIQDAALVEQIDGVQSANVSEMWQLNGSERSLKPNLIVSVRIAGRIYVEEGFAQQIAKMIVENDHTIQRYGAMRIDLVRSYDIGIASGWTSRWWWYSSAAWGELLSGDSPLPDSR